MNYWVRRLAAGGLLLLATLAIDATGRAQAPAADPLQPLAFLLGRWEGTSEGQPGVGVVTREYTRVLNSRFIRAQNQSVYKPQDKNPKGEVHDDVGFFSFDKARKRMVFRQFHGEGFVAHYVHDTSETARLVFISEALENIPAGYRARETYIAHGPDEFEEIFELAGPGREFEIYAHTRLKRAR